MTYNRELTGKAAIAAVQYGKEGEYWLKKFSGELQKVSFPYDFNIKSQPKHHTNHNIAFEIKAPYGSKLMELSKGLDYRLYIILTAGLVALLYKYTGNKDIIIGSPIFKQDKEGNFVNTMLPLRNLVDGAMTFRELLLDHVRPTIIEANEHQNYPIETLLFQLNMPVAQEEFPLFDVVILLENIHEKKYIHPVHPNLVFSFLRTNDGIEGKIEYNPALYRRDTIDRIIYHFKRLLEEVLVNVNIFISEIDILGDEEKQQILYDFNRGNQQANYPHHKTLHRLFAEQVERSPGYAALVGVSAGVGTRFIASTPGKQYVHLTYHELNEKSNQLAHLLIEKGVKADTIVGIMMERSVEMIIGILGILKAGGAYLPIDPDYPQERINYMLADSDAKIVLTSDAINRVPTPNHLLVHLSTLTSFSTSTLTSTSTSTCQVSPANLAYTIYTSGTTGKPKGSLIIHRNVVSLMFHDNYLFDFGSNDVWTMFHSYCFDFSVWEMYGALLYGGKLVLISKMTARDPQQFLQILKTEQVTVLNQTPAAFYQLAQQELDRPGRNLRLKYVIFGGEALTPAKLIPWKEKYPGTKLINMFGITETTVHVTYKEILHNDIKLNISNIGGPLPTLNVYIIDRHRNLLPIGVPGELFVSGAGVCRGYLNQPELTAEKFDHDLWDYQDYHDGYHRSYKSYKTGDLGRWLPDGNIEYLGRIDHQVKIRGYRVELGEIEAQLMRHFAVKEAAALEWEDTDGLKALNAYVVPDPQYAYPVKQLTELDRAGRLENQRCHEYPNGMTIFYINRHETDFMYREIFEERSYIQEGITLEEGACIFDVGANIGIFSLFVHQACKNAKIYAFEPIPPIFEVLSLNTSIYCRDLEVFPCGLAGEESEAVFTYYPHATVLSGRFADRSQETETVKAYIKNEPGKSPEEERLSEGQVNELLADRLKNTSFTCKMKSLSRIIREKGIEKIDLLKIDVEKAEIDVLNGIDDTDWPKIRQLVIEVHDVDERLKKITQQLHRRGYRVVVRQDHELKNTGLYNVYAVSEAKAITGSQPPDVVKKKALDDHDYYLGPGRFIDDLRTFLKEKVPEYMVPSYFVLLDHIPLNPNGKVDRKALPSPGIKTGTGYIAPRNQAEVKLTEIWAEVLGIEKDGIGIDSDFFQLGGHSLKATIFISKLHKVLNVKIPLAILFKTPTIRQLAQYIGGLKMNRFIGLGAVEKKDYYPLSSAQKRLYVLQQMELASIAYNVPQVLELAGELNRISLEKTFRQLIERHESLRTSFDIIREKPVQKIHQEVKFEIEYDRSLVNCQGRGEVASPVEFSSNPRSVAALISSFIRPFDLSNASLLRVGLIQEQEQKHILMIDMHHIVTDGTSMDLFVKESMAMYAGEKLLPLKFQYKDYSQWQNSEQQKEAIKKQEEYWLKQFSDEVPVLNLSLDYSRPAIQSFEGAVLFFGVSAELTRLINRMTRDTGATLYMVLLAIYNVLLSKLSGQEDIIVGTPIAARRHVDLERIIGMFVNTLAMRNYPSDNKKFIDFLKELTNRTLDNFENQEYQFEDLVEKVSVQRDTSRNPLFDTMFVLQNMETRGNEIPIVNVSQLKINPYETEHRTAKFDLTLICLESEEKLFCTFEYCTKLFNKYTIERFIIYFQKILSTVLENPNQKIYQIEIITAEEKRQVLYEFNDTMAAYDREKTLHQLFAQQVERTPDNIALTGPLAKKYKSYMTYISYSKLNEKSHQLALLLINKGVRPDTIVGIMVERSLEMIIGILGILKAGGAYLPIDPGNPEGRIKYMLKDSSAKFLVTTPGLSGKFEKLLIVNCHLLIVNETLPGCRRLNNPPQEANSINNYHLTINNSQLNSSNLAYVIYTSGSTGSPKGVPITHDNFSPLVHWGYRLGVSQRDRAIQNLSYYFDWSVWEIFIVLTCGAALYMITNEILLNPGAEVDFILENAITVLHITPGQYQYLIDVGKKLKTLKYLFLGAEKLTAHLTKCSIESVSDHCRIFNMYGPTEATIISSVLEIQRQGAEQHSALSSVPIGKPVGNMVLLVLARHLTLCPINITGQLYIAGDGVAKGYLNKPALTFERFISYKLQNTECKQIPNYKIQITNKEAPLGRILNASGETAIHHSPLPIHHSPIYRTGDLCRWLPDGNIEFMGRIDHQVKIRGYRIELGEIENQLLSCEGIKEAVVVVRENDKAGKYLCAYVSAAEELTVSALRAALVEKLPDYMIPSYFVLLEHIPITPNGKIDRKALPEPQLEASADYQAPRDHIEEKLVEIWSEILELNKEMIGIDTNFFAIGGHSLKATSVIYRVNNRFNMNLPMVELFKAPYIRQMGEYIRHAAQVNVTPPYPDKNLLLLRQNPGKAGNIFFIHDGTGEVDGYVEFCKCLNNPFNYWGIRANRLENYTPLNLSIEETAKHYIEKIKKIQPHGPYSIAGWSLGGVIAFEMALQLETMGQKTTFLGLIDAPCPHLDGNDDVIPFSLQTEVSLIINSIPNRKIKKRIKNISDVNEVWPALIDCMEENNIGVNTIKRLIPDDLTRIIPNYNQIGTRDLIYYLNMHRTLTNALLRYLPGKPINTPIHYFKASQSPEAVKKGWYDYCKKSLEIHQVEGDHFSILRKPVVNQLKKIFIAALKKVYPC